MLNFAQLKDFKTVKDLCFGMKVKSESLRHPTNPKSMLSLTTKMTSLCFKMIDKDLVFTLNRPKMLYTKICQAFGGSRLHEADD